MTAPPFRQLLAAYPAEEIGDFISAEPITLGLIHQTYKLTTSAGQFSFQRLHPKLASDAIMADYDAVLSHLAKKGFPAPRLQKTRAGAGFVTASDGHRWRLTSWLSGRAHTTVTSPAMARAGAGFLARFHATMADIDYTFQSTHPLHQTRHHLQRLQEAAETHASSPWMPKIKALLEGVQTTLPTLILPDDIPQHVVHGDPKISNILFDPDGQACGIIDLDTCTRHSLLVDLGDAIRSWCRDGGEDQPNPFSLERCAALFEGYAAQAPPLSATERALLPQAGRLITLELTARFLTDVLEDNYFGWDRTRYPDRPSHNFARAQGMWALAQEMEQAQARIEDFVSRAFD